MLNNVSSLNFYSTQAQYAKKTDNAQRPQARSNEAFEGETKLLKKIYDEYMKNVGGYQYIDGKMVHVTTVLHIDKSAQAAVIAIENRLRELGELP